MSAAIEDWVLMLDPQLAELADGDDQTLGFLALAWESLNSDRDRQLAISAWVRTRIGGSEGERLICWADVLEAVDMWTRWTLVCDSQGRTSELSIPSREKVADDVVYALQALRVRSVA